MGKRPYKVRKNNPPIPTSWRQGENLGGQNEGMAEHPKDGLAECVADSDFPDYEEVESDHLSLGMATSVMILDDSGAMSSSALSSSSSLSTTGNTDGTPDPLWALQF
jgi:hypothetical protein